MMPDADNMDLRARVVSTEQKVAENASRISALEQRQTQADIAEARKNEQWTNLVEKFAGLNLKMDSVDASLNK